MPRPCFQLPDQQWLERARTKVRAALAMPEEGPAEHCRNALAILRFSIEHDEPLLGNG